MKLFPITFDFQSLSSIDKKVMFNTIDKMTNVHVDMSERMFNAHAYISQVT